MSIYVLRGDRFWNRRYLADSTVMTLRLEKQPHKEADENEPDNDARVAEHC